MSEEAKTKGFANPYPYPQPQPPPPTYQGVAAYPPPPPTAGFPQPVAPPQPQYYPQPVPGYAMEEGRPKPARERRLPCCGCGLGWVLFIIGFFLGAIPWYIGTIILLFRRNKLDHREKPGYVACAVAAVIGTIIIIIGVSTGMEVVHEVPVGQRLPCCGLCLGWTLCLLGCFLGFPWHIGAVYMCCIFHKKDYSEWPGYFACLFGAIFLTIGIIIQLVIMYRTNENSNPKY